MRRKTAAGLLELIPVLSAPASLLLLYSSVDTIPVRRLIAVTMIFSFLGFAFFLIGRRLSNGSKTVRILGILDLLATLYVVLFYTLVIFPGRAVSQD